VRVATTTVNVMAVTEIQGDFQKNMSGTQNALYIPPRYLYTKTIQTFKYSLVRVKIKERKMSKYEKESLSMWHEYHSNGGRVDFETFYGHELKNQRLLVRVSKWASILRGKK